MSTFLLHFRLRHNFPMFLSLFLGNKEKQLVLFISHAKHCRSRLGQPYHFHLGYFAMLTSFRLFITPFAPRKFLVLNRAASLSSQILIRQYLTYPTSTSLDLSVLPAAQMPWVTVCNSNAYRLDAILSAEIDETHNFLKKSE